MKFAGPKKNFWDELFLKGFSSNLFRTSTENLPGFSKDNLGVFVKTGFSVSEETFGEKFFSLQKLQFVIFQTREGNFRLTVGKSSGGFETAFYLSREPFEKKLVELSKPNSQFQWKLSGEKPTENLQNVIFWISSGNISASCREKSQRGFQAAF